MISKEERDRLRELHARERHAETNAGGHLYYSQNLLHESTVSLPALLDALDAADAEIARLRAALQPLRLQADIIDANDRADGNDPKPDFFSFRFDSSYTAISIGDCREARKALEGT